MKDNIKYFIGCSVPVYSCNLRCKYCYLTHKGNEAYKGGIKKFSLAPQTIANILSIKKLGGPCYFNFCAAGETLMHPQLISLVGLLTDQGHYSDIITNGLMSRKIEVLIDTLTDKQKSHLMIKFSFHYLQLKERKLLDRFVDNVNKIRESGISYSIEITPHDELIPYIQEIKDFSLEKFGALPHITVARNEATKEIELLTSLSREQYKKIWSVFDSKMFDFKFQVFGEKRTEVCYAGLWSFQINLESGAILQCYRGDTLCNLKHFNISKLRPICRCREPHCFNGHAYLSFGTIPSINSFTYLDMRDREMDNGQHWIHGEAYDFFKTRLENANNECSSLSTYLIRIKRPLYAIFNTICKLDFCISKIVLKR